MSFHDPSIWWLLGLLALPVMWWRAWANTRRGAVEYSSIASISAVRSSVWLHLRWVPLALRSVVVALLVVSMARPQIADEHSEVYTDGIAIQLVIDRSRSMEEQDYRLDDRRATRLEVAKYVISDFVDSSGELGGRPNDLIGVIQFGTFADALCPFTLDEAHVTKAIQSIQSPSNLSEARTSIGDAVALALERIRSLDEEGLDDSAYRVTSRIIILLTDGDDQGSLILPVTAARMAATMGVKVYAVGIGNVNAQVGRPVNEQTLQMFEQVTGGRYYYAASTDSLEEVYEDINSLERSRIEQEQYTDYLEVALEPFELFGITMPPILLVALGFLLLERTLMTTRLGGLA